MILYKRLETQMKAVSLAKDLHKNYVVTLLAPSLNLSVIKAISTMLADKGINLLKTKTLASKEIECVEISISSDQTIHQRHLTQELLTHIPSTLDIAIQEENILRQRKRLIVLDMDSTLTQIEVIDELAKEAGVGDQVVSITSRAMHGELSFPEALRERVYLLKGLSESALEKVYKRMPFTPGAERLLSILKKMGLRTAVLSGGFDYFTSRVKEVLKLDDAFSNKLEVVDGVLTGKILGDIVDGEKKLFLMEEIAQKEGISIEQIIAVGDGANDIPMIKHAGLGIAFNAKPAVRKEATYNITQKSLITVLYLLGLTEKEIKYFEFE
ncbi:MAG: phosphoserine phosphatase SerB [Nitrospiria bacterium]